MKNTSPKLPFSASGARGSALIAVLSLIVLMAALVTVFLVRASMERTASASYDAAASTRLLAEATVNMVQATINEATANTDGEAWASQPGAIRLFNSSGDLTRIFRLYSAPEIASTTSSGSVLAADIPPADWASQSAVWVDLNRPVTVTGFSTADNLVYPILDPRDPKNPSDLLTTKKSDGSQKLEGFSISGAPGTTSLQPAPMPVRWLYVLRDGKIVAPSNGGASSVTVPGASSANPITGRIAFWTDDESAKVNINTAAGSFGTWDGSSILPAPWDVPRFRMLDDTTLFSKNQPVQGEYQRYPGHPANTDLYAIFNALGIPVGSYPGTQTTAGNATSFFSLLPRYNDTYGSKGGTTYTTQTNNANKIMPKTDRLYTSVGELLYDPARNSNGATRQELESGKFLLTAQSRAPETTLFGTPRIAMWPIDSDYGSDPTEGNPTKLASTFDKLIAFCSTIGTGTNRKRFYFQRHDSTSPTNDYENIQRNKDLYAYLQNLTSKQIPGFGGNFKSKYSFSNERDQILTQMFDYIRCTNLYDHAIQDPDPSNPYARFTPRSNNPTTGGGQVVPIKIGSTRGQGRMYTISEIGLVLICTADGNGSGGSDLRTISNNIATNPTLEGSALTSGQKRLQAMLVLELYSPMLGYDTMMPDVQINIRNLDRLHFTGTDGVLKTPFASGDITTESPGTRYNEILQMGGLNGFQYFISRLNWGNNTRRNAWNNPSATGSIPYRFVSIPFTVPTDAAGNGSVSMASSGSFTIELMAKMKGTSTRQVVQTFDVFFPATVLPLPDLIQTAAGTSTPQDWWGFDKRIEWAASSVSTSGAQDKGAVIRAESSTIPDIEGAQGIRSDVVRTLFAKDGDVRLVMAKDEVKADGSADMVTHPKYFSTSYKLVHLLMQAKASNIVPGVDLGGKLVQGANYEPAWAPKVPSTTSPASDWDWDSGLPGTRDGAYVNKPDEGNIYTSGGTAPYFNGENQENSATTSNLPTYFTANRIIPSPVMFGSLPTGVKEGIPWRTLLFQPQANRPRDPSGPKDHLLLDLFDMPVVEPYAISEPFSAAGKVNMNYQIVPFNYIDRSTSVRAVLGSELMARVPKAAAARKGTQTGHAYYKIPYGNTPGTNEQPPGAPPLRRLPLNLSDTDGTLRQFKEKFAAWDIFKSASEICDIYLVPKGYNWTSNTQADAAWYGDDFALVGDNVRERPYANIYPRLTTKSNTFTVHYTVQTLKNPPTNNPDTWSEARGVITGELRGSTTLERFLDPADSNIPDYATNPGATSLDNYYQWRVISNSTFAP